jgi:hypothetical protein
MGATGQPTWTAFATKDLPRKTQAKSLLLRSLSAARARSTQWMGWVNLKPQRGNTGFPFLLALALNAGYLVHLTKIWTISVPLLTMLSNFALLGKCCGQETLVSRSLWWPRLLTTVVAIVWSQWKSSYFELMSA